MTSIQIDAANVTAFYSRLIRPVAFLLAPVLAVSTALAQQATGTGSTTSEQRASSSESTVRGRIIDATGGALPGATVMLTDAQATTVTVAADETGTYVFRSLAPGRYTAHAFFPGFAPYDNTDVDITAGRTRTLPILLNIEAIKEEGDLFDYVANLAEIDVDASCQRGVAARVLGKSESIRVRIDGAEFMEQAGCLLDLFLRRAG